jgi:hypothetical protein
MLVQHNFGAGSVKYSAGLGRNYDWRDRARLAGNTVVVLSGQLICADKSRFGQIIQSSPGQSIRLQPSPFQSGLGFRGLVKAGHLGYLWA